MIRAAIALLALLMLPAGADAYCGDYSYRRSPGCREWPYFDCRMERYCRYWVRERDRDETRVYGYERRERDEEPARVNCLYDHPAIQATGDDKLEEDRAQVSAQDRWSITVETLRGTRFSDIRFAARLTSACVRKVPTSATEKGQAVLGVRHFVCTVEATPCAAPKLLQDEDTRAKRGSEKRDDEAGRKADPARVEYYDAPPPRKRWYQRR